jgi:hypothetical protein
MKSSTRRVMAVLLVLEIGLIGLFGYGFYRWAIQWRLNGPRLIAQVGSREFTSTGKYYVRYRYTVEGVEYARKHRVTPAFFKKIAVGQDLEIVYSPIAPEISGIPGQGIGDFEVSKLPGTFFDLKFLIFVLPAAMVFNLLLMMAISIRARRNGRKSRR